MSGSAKVNFNVTNLTQSVGTPPAGIAFVQGQSARGPFDTPDEVINSWPVFVAKFGGLISESDAPLICKRMLEGGASIRFSRVGHYTNITDKSTLTAVKAAQPTITKIVFDENFVTGNEIDITLNGDDLDTVTFTTNNDNTLDLVAAAIQSHADVSLVNVVEDLSGDGNKILTVVPKGNATLTFNISITGGVSQPTDTISTSTTIVSQNGDSLFRLVPKYEGADYNNFRVTITPGSNGIEGYFNINIKHQIEQNIQENYVNLFIPAGVTASNSNYLDRLVKNSIYFDVIYEDVPNTSPVYPLPIVFNFSGGDNGGTPENADYVGDSNSKTGLHAFDAYDDAYSMATLDNDSTVVALAGSNYAFNRKDLVYFKYLNGLTKLALITERETLGDNKFLYQFGGVGKIKDPITSQDREINPIGDILVAEAQSSRNFGPWYSFAGPQRGILRNLLGVVNNFGTPGALRDLDELANKQINMVVTKNGQTMLWGNFSSQYKDDQEKFISIVRLVIFLKKSLKPLLESFLEEPNDIPTWKRMHYTVKPFLDSLITKRAIYSYTWDGDQNANSMNDLVVNNSADVTEGKYKVRLAIQAIPSIQEINLDLIMTPAGIQFDIVSELL